MSEHPMQAESTEQSPKEFLCVSCVCVCGGGGGGGGEAPLAPPLDPPLIGTATVPYGYISSPIRFCPV